MLVLVLLDSGSQGGVCSTARWTEVRLQVHNSYVQAPLPTAYDHHGALNHDQLLRCCWPHAMRACVYGLWCWVVGGGGAGGRGRGGGRVATGCRNVKAAPLPAADSPLCATPFVTAAAVTPSLANTGCARSRRRKANGEPSAYWPGAWQLMPLAKSAWPPEMP
jgi:hypothetical protein